MAFSKLNFAMAACLLLGTSGLLISCNETKPTSPTKPVNVSTQLNVSTQSSNPICVETAGIIAIEVPSEICNQSAEPKAPKDHEEKSPDCIHPDLQA